MNDTPPAEALPAQAVPLARIVYCTNCGADLNGLQIGSPCPACGVPVGSAKGGAGRSSGKAVAVLVLGICSIVGCMFYGLPGLACGIIAIILARSVKRDVEAGELSPSALSMSNAGRICGMVGTSLSALMIILSIGYFVWVFAYFVPQTQLQQQHWNTPTVAPAQPTPSQPAPLPTPAPTPAPAPTNP